MRLAPQFAVFAGAEANSRVWVVFMTRDLAMPGTGGRPGHVRGWIVFHLTLYLLSACVDPANRLKHTGRQEIQREIEWPLVEAPPLSCTTLPLATDRLLLVVLKLHPLVDCWQAIDRHF